MHSSELGMLLPFAFVMFAVWSVTRVMLARTHARGSVPVNLQRQLDDLTTRLEQVEQSLDGTVREVQRLAEAEQFTTRLLTGELERDSEPSLARSVR
jgi:hypothetical protein